MATTAGSYKRAQERKQLRELKQRRKDLEAKEKQAQQYLRLEKYREKILGDFYLFAKDFLGFEDLYEPFHRPLCEKISDNRIRRSLFLIPRGHFKTTLISIAYPIYLLCCDPNERIILAGAVVAKSVENLQEIVERISTRRFQSVFGHIIPPPNKWVQKDKEKIRLPRESKVTGPTILCLGVDSSEVGRHASRILIDDPVSKDQVNSIAARRKTWNWFGRQYSVLDPGETELTVLGTRWHGDDVYSKILTLDGWYVERREYKEHGKYIFPTRFNDKYIKEVKRVQDPYTFSCFYLNNPIGEGVNPFDTDQFWFEEYPLHDQKPGPTWTYLLVDPATTTEDYSCPSAFVIGDAVNTSRGKRFVVRRVISQKMAPNAFIDYIFTLYEQYRFRAVAIESEAQQVTLHYWLKREQVAREKRFEIQEVKCPRGEKRTKLLWGLQPLLHEGAIIFDKKMEGKEDLIDEFSSYPKGATDDIILAISFIPQAVSYPGTSAMREEPKKIPPRSRFLMEMIQENRKKRKVRRRGRLPSIGRMRHSKLIEL